MSQTFSSYYCSIPIPSQGTSSRQKCHAADPTASEVFKTPHTPPLWQIDLFQASRKVDSCPKKKKKKIELEGKITTVSRVASRQEFKTIHRAKNQKTPESSAKKELSLLLLWRFVTTKQQKFKSNNLSELKSERFFLVLVLLKFFSSGNQICSNNERERERERERGRV